MGYENIKFNLDDIALIVQNHFECYNLNKTILNQLDIVKPNLKNETKIVLMNSIAFFS